MQQQQLDFLPTQHYSNDIRFWAIKENNGMYAATEYNFKLI